MICFVSFFVKQKTAYEMRNSDWSSDVCSSDLGVKCVLRTKPKPSYTTTILAVSIYHTEEKRRSIARSTRDLAQRKNQSRRSPQIGRASCRERVCKYV